MASVFKGMTFENMARQSGRLYADLTNAYAQLRSSGKFTTEDIKRIGFSDIIRAHTGMYAEVAIETKYKLAAFIALPPIDKNHVFVQNYYRERFAGSELGEALVSLRDNPRGTVDTQSGMVGGVFKELRITVNMGQSLVMGSEFTAEELAAITLHELGHAFTYFLHLGTTATSALMAGAIARGVMGAETYGERIKVIEEGERVLGVDIPNKNKLSELTPEMASKMVSAVVIKHQVEYNQSQAGTTMYEARACEQLADEFAIKHGAGAALSTALAKLGKMYWHKAYWNPVVYLIFESIKVTVFLIRAIFLAQYNWVTRAILAIDLISFYFWCPALKVYDDPKQRNKLILQRLIETLKEPNLSEAIIVQVKEDIELVKEIQEQTRNHPDVFDLIWHHINPNGRQRLREEEFNKQLEDLMFNELFEHAATFRIAKA